MRHFKRHTSNNYDIQRVLDRLNQSATPNLKFKKTTRREQLDVLHGGNKLYKRLDEPGH